MRHLYDERQRRIVLMNEHDWLAERFEAHHMHVRSVAYRMLGSCNGAANALQEYGFRLRPT